MPSTIPNVSLNLCLGGPRCVVCLAASCASLGRGVPPHLCLGVPRCVVSHSSCMQGGKVYRTRLLGECDGLMEILQARLQEALE